MKLTIVILSILFASCIVSAYKEAGAGTAVDIEYDVPHFNSTEIAEHLEKYGTLPMSTCSKAAGRANYYGTCGCPYVYGGSSCACGGHGGLDCSGIVYRSYLDAGWTGISRTTFTQINQGNACNKGCSPSNTKACTVGDLFFYCFEQPCPSHVIMYIGGNKAAECPYPGLDCHITTPYMNNYQACRSMCN